MKVASLLILLCSMFWVSGCTHALHQNHTSDYKLTAPLSDYRLIEARYEQRVVLGFVQQTHYVDDAFAELRRQCPDGEITGIQTRYSTSHGFLSWTNVILMRGYCSH